MGEQMKVNIRGDYITLGQFLKKVDIIVTGGESGFFLEEEQVYVNEERETRRGRKLYREDRIVISGQTYVIK